MDQKSPIDSSQSGTGNVQALLSPLTVNAQVAVIVVNNSRRTAPCFSLAKGLP